MKAVRLIVLAGILGASALLAPTWIGFAAAGFLLGWAVRRVRPRVRLVSVLPILCGLLGVVTLGLLVVSMAIPSLMKARHVGRSQLHRVHYAAEARYDAALPGWQLRDRIEVQVNLRALKQQISAAAGGTSDSEAADLPPDAVRRWLAPQLREQGWKAADLAADDPVFERERTLRTRHPWYAARFGHQLAVLAPDLDLPAFFAVDPYGEVRLQAPPNMIGTTKPAASRRASKKPAKWETVVVPFEFPLLSSAEGRPAVEFETLHPALQNPLVAGIRHLVEMPIINWLLLGLFGVFQERLRERLFRPWTAWLGHSRWGRWLGESAARPAPAELGAACLPGTAARSALVPPRPTGILGAFYDDRPSRRERAA